MIRTFALLLLMAIGSVGVSGCFSLIDWEHNLNHLKVWNQDLNNIHQDIDFFFFNYDWDDPSRDLNFETPNT